MHCPFMWHMPSQTPAVYRNSTCMPWCSATSITSHGPADMVIAAEKEAGLCKVVERSGLPCLCSSSTTGANMLNVGHPAAGSPNSEHRSPLHLAQVEFSRGCSGAWQGQAAEPSLSKHGPARCRLMLVPELCSYHKVIDVRKIQHFEAEYRKFHCYS